MPPMDIDTSRRNKMPRPLSDDERARLEEFIDSIHYSSRYDYIKKTSATLVLVLVLVLLLVLLDRC